MRHLTFIKPSAVRAHVKEKGRRCGSDFLILLDEFVRSKIDHAIETHNGSKKTLDADVAAYVGVRP